MNTTSLSASEHTGLAGRVCAITGGGSGIGRAAALAFARLGAHVAVIDRDLAGAQATVAQAEALGAKAVAIACDTSDEAAVTAAAARSQEALGPCNVLVNAAGVLKAASLEDMSLQEWNRVMSINLTGYFLCSQAFGRQMRTQGAGAIIHIASIAAVHPTGHSGAYSVSKAAVSMLSRQLAIEWGPQGIRSNAVCPGMTWTGMTQESYGRPGIAELRSQGIPLRRIGQPEEIADAIVYLASDRSGYVNGVELTVDGGFTRNLMSLMPRTAN
ncbi:MAG: SDR family oxidoreductase [Pseudomonadota bacterium]